MKELLLCALNRIGKPAEGGEILDMANALAMDANWPQRTWKCVTVQQVVRHMQGMESRGEVLKGPGRKWNARTVPQWTLASFDAKAPMPEQPDPEGEEHPLHGKTNRQKFVLFDVMDGMLATYARMQGEISDLVCRHNRELSELAGRTKRDLLAAGIEDAQ